MAVTTKKVLIDLKPDSSLINPDFDGYKLSLESLPLYEQNFEIGVARAEPSPEQYSFQHVRLFGLHNHLYGDPWNAHQLYYFNEKGELILNRWSSVNKKFDCSEVWCESTFLKPCSRHETGDYNYSLSLDCEDKVFIYTGRKNGSTLCIINTEDRGTSDAWCKTGIVVENLPPGILMSSACSEDKNGSSFHCLVQSVVEASTIEELEAASKQQGMFATLLQWISISKTDSGSYEKVAQRDICVHGPVEYAVFEPGSSAVYVASQRKAFFANDSVRPVTPILQRAFRKPQRYMWEQTDSEIIVRFSLPWLLVESNLKVNVEDAAVAISVLVEEQYKDIISGNTFKKLDSDSTKSEIAVHEGRVEIKLKKEVIGENWDEFLCNDENGTPAPGANLVEAATGALQHLTSENEEDGEVVPGFNSGQLEECDASPPDTARLVRLSTETHAPTHRVQLSAHQLICSSQLVPGCAAALVLRHDVDAVAWQPEKPDTDTWKFRHVNTFNAFGYVQAGKENKKFMACPPDLSYIAICEASHHVYLYHQPSALSTDLRNRKSGQQVHSVAKQQVVRVPNYVDCVMGVYATNTELFILSNNVILTLAIH